MKKEHILVIRFSALGDVAMAVPVVWALATQYPDIRITVLSKAFARTLFDDLAPNVNFMDICLHPRDGSGSCGCPMGNGVPACLSPPLETAPCRHRRPLYPQDSR